MKRTKKVICMGMVLSMVLCLNLSACAARMNDSELTEGSYESSSAGQTESSWWGSGSDSGTQTETIFDWINKYYGSSQGDDGTSEETSGETSDQTYSAPANVSVKSSMSANSRTLEYSWDKVEGADKYIIQLSTTDDFTGDDLRESTTKNTQYKYSIRNSSAVYYYPAHRTYYFRVKAVFGNHESAWSYIVVSYGDADKQTD